MTFLQILVPIFLLLISQVMTQPQPPIPPQAGYISPFENVTRLECTAEIFTNGLMSGRVGEEYRWKKFHVFPDNEFDEEERRAINDAMWHVSQTVPCIKFGIWPRGSNPTGDYVYISKKDKGCWAYIGRLGGRQEMNLQTPGCMNNGIIMHELIHALGFTHEHNRPDRDDFVNIHWDNIQPGFASQFEKHPAFRETFGVPYDQESIMHYRSHEFSRNNKPTITARNGKKVGDNGHLRDSDKMKLKKMYKC